MLGSPILVVPDESKHGFKEVNDAKLEYLDPLDCLGEPMEQRASLPVPATTESVGQFDNPYPNQ